LSALPSNTFPAWAQEYIDAEAAATETPRELATADVLGAIATANQPKHIVEVRPGYTEPLSIWALAALPSGHLKTAVLNDSTQPIVDYETLLREQILPEIKKKQSERATLEARIQKLRSTAAFFKGPALDRAKAEIADLEANVPEIPAELMLWSQDATVERLVSDMADQGGAMAIISDEAGLLDILAGRYSNGIPNLDAVLQGHSGSRARVTRRTRTVDLPNPVLTMILSPQPAALRRLARPDHPFRGRGLMASFAYLCPNPISAVARAKAPQCPLTCERPTANNCGNCLASIPRSTAQD
jgi:hypothetical protein